MRIQGLAYTIISIAVMGILASCVEPVADAQVTDEPVAAAAAPSGISGEATPATRAPDVVWFVTCIYRCPDTSRLFVGRSTIPGEACSRAQRACDASGCGSCEFVEIFSTP